MLQLSSPSTPPVLPVEIRERRSTLQTVELSDLGELMW